MLELLSLDVRDGGVLTRLHVSDLDILALHAGWEPTRGARLWKGWLRVEHSLSDRYLVFVARRVDLVASVGIPCLNIRVLF